MKMSRSKIGLLVGFGISVTMVGELLAHDFWLIPDAFRLAPGAVLHVRGQTSSAFPTSESAIAVDRIGEAIVFDSRGRETATDLSHSGSSLLLRHRPRRAGEYMVAMTILPRTVRESPESFRRYLTLEGAPEVLARLERERGLPTDSITRRYAKYAKTLVQVGENGPRAFGIVAGHPLEFVPLIDPASVRPGRALAFQLLLKGRPIPNVKIHAGSVAQPRQGALNDVRGGQDVELRTNVNGIVNVTIDRPGTWNVRALYLEPAAPGSGADWETHWVTLVFAIDGTDRRTGS